VAGAGRERGGDFDPVGLISGRNSRVVVVEMRLPLLWLWHTFAGVFGGVPHKAGRGGPVEVGRELGCARGKEERRRVFSAAACSVRDAVLRALPVLPCPHGACRGVLYGCCFHLI
jgi:hypothetical protein